MLLNNTSQPNISDYEGLLLNLKAGLLPKDLSEYEVTLLINHNGINWFDDLGYDEFYTERSKYDINKLYN